MRTATDKRQSPIFSSVLCIEVILCIETVYFRGCSEGTGISILCAGGSDNGGRD